ncbi:ABC transporter ATP-binding protein [Jannaschia sp. CCS1]|uniref:ABC transporter ATP-binding protein n=1 Tax=Jannaschia sp. (strain CCS1) TaxID=290400 RepID=UPI00140F881D|nr:ABC transporter ATP-binding protein [Jannaschia sp. CCS1]
MFNQQDRQNLRWFWQSYLRSKSIWLLIVLGMVSVQGLVYQQFLQLTESGLRVIFEDGSFRQLALICAYVFFLFAVRAALSYLVPRLSVWLASDAVVKLRADLTGHLLQQDLAYFERTKVGDTILRLFTQADGLGAFVGVTTVGAARDAVTVVIVAGYLIYKSPLLFLGAVVFIPIVIFMMQLISHKIKDIQAQAENAFGAYINTIEEMSNGMRTVKISGQEGHERDRLNTAAMGMRGLMIRLQSAQAMVAPTIDLVSACAYVLVIGGGGYMVISGDFDLDAAGIITFLLGLTILFDPARRLAQFFATLQASLVLLESLNSILRLEPTVHDLPGAKDTFDASADIQLNQVDFGYSKDDPLYEGLDLTIKGGQSTAIVGATGSGKTTVLSLITRLYEVDKGAVTIGGDNIRDIKVKALRKAFSVVAQDIVIFNASIFENIKYVRPEASDDEVWAAAEVANIADLMRQRGDTPLGPKGSQLSGGQKQRIAIARAVLQDAPILLMDEATSALDQKTEEKVRDALERVSEGRTSVMIAHRLSTVIHADWIYVLDFGKVVEQGTHADLMAQDGLYAAMYRSQKTGYE